MYITTKEKTLKMKGRVNKMNIDKSIQLTIEKQYRISNARIREQMKKKNETTLKDLATSEGFIIFFIVTMVLTIISCIGL